MICSACQRPNRADSRFCLGCGAALPAQCAHCGRSLPGDALFCDGCGRAREGAAGLATPVRRDAQARLYTPAHLAEKILKTRSALQGERKLVTVLFADVKDSVALGAQVDSEQWHATMDRFFLLLADGVHRFEGTINQYTGDGIMALFGAPVAHEDHAARACFAALHLQDSIRYFAHALRRERGLDFGVRLAMNSGEVIVGKIGDDLRMDYTAKGQTVGLAARIEQITEGGRVYVSGATRDLVEGQFRFDDLGAFRLKGLSEPARVFELLGAGPLRSRLDVSRARGFSRFVGRESEMEVLDAALARAAGGRGQVVGVAADAGTGKSRLCWEFTERCQSRGIEVHRAQAVSHGAGLPFLPIVELLRVIFGISERDDGERARQKIAGALVLLDPALESALPALFDFMGASEPGGPPLALGPEQRQRQLLEVLLRSLTQRRRGEPCVVLVEDLHWIDAGSEALLGKLAAAIGEAPVLLLLNYRPEYRAAWMQSAVYSQVALDPLDGAAVDALLADLLGSDPSVSELPARIRERTGGNPFFVEEVIRSLVEAGALTGTRGAHRLNGPLDRLEIPESVRSVLAARIDRLGDDAKQLLQAGAVVGKQFSAALVERVAGLADARRGAALAVLVESELVYEEALYPDIEYAFRHPLTCEVAYATLLGERRRELHAAIADAIAALEAGRLDENAALLAHHYAAADRVADAARWSARAADRAGFVDPRAAYYHWRRVRELAARVGDSHEDRGAFDALRLRACWSVLAEGGRGGLPIAEARAIFDDGMALAEHATERRDQVRLHAAFAARLGWSGDREGQARHLMAADRLAEDLDDLEIQLFVLHRRFVFAFHGGDLPGALALAERGIAQLEAEPGFGERHGYAHERLWLSKANALAQMGRLHGCAQALSRAAAVAPQVHTAAGGEQNSHTRALVRATLSLYGGDVEASLRDALALAALAERSGSSWAAPVSHLALGRAYLLAARWDAARATLERSLAGAREADLGLESEAAHLACLAEALAGCGDAEAALATGREAVGVARAAGTKYWELQAQLSFGHVALAARGLSARAEVTAALDRSRDLLAETGGAAMAPVLARLEAELHDTVGDAAAGDRARREADRLTAAMTNAS